MDQETENSVKSIMSSLNQQDNKQKIGMYFAFIMEFYRVLMGSFLILFVPQKCDNEICGLFENVITGNPVIDTAFSVNIAVFSLFMAMYYAELIRENKMINYLHVNPELPRDNEAVGEALVNLPERKKESIFFSCLLAHDTSGSKRSRKNMAKEAHTWKFLADSNPAADRQF